MEIKSIGKLKNHSGFKNLQSLNHIDLMQNWSGKPRISYSLYKKSLGE